MTGIQTFLQNICSFLNRKGILKRCYRCCAILTVGVTIVAVTSLTGKDFGGKNKVSAAVLKSAEETEEEKETTENSEQAEAVAEVSESAIEAHSSEEQPEQVEIETREAQLESRAVETVSKENEEAVIEVTEKEYEILTRIVEAEAGTEDVKGKMLVANVVLNRVAYHEFPDNIEGVVFQRQGKRYQFSPVKDGSYYRVTVQDSTKLAVDRVLAGEDESMGALFFCERAISSSSNLRWFDSELELLFDYGCHEFFKYAE